MSQSNTNIMQACVGNTPSVLILATDSLLVVVLLLQEGEVSPDLGNPALAGDGTWAGQSQQASPAPSPARGVGPFKRQTISGEASRGRSPEPDPTGTEDSPLSQVITSPRPPPQEA